MSYLVDQAKRIFQSLQFYKKPAVSSKPIIDTRLTSNHRALIQCLQVQDKPYDILPWDTGYIGAIERQVYQMLGVNNREEACSIEDFEKH